MPGYNNKISFAHEYDELEWKIKKIINSLEISWMSFFNQNWCNPDITIRKLYETDILKGLQKTPSVKIKTKHERIPQTLMEYFVKMYEA